MKTTFTYFLIIAITSLFPVASHAENPTTTIPDPHSAHLEPNKSVINAVVF